MKRTKKSLLASGLALVACLALLMGATPMMKGPCMRTATAPILMAAAFTSVWTANTFP